MSRDSLQLWSNGPSLPLPDKPSDITRAFAWVGGVLAGIGLAGSFLWWLFYYLPWRAMNCHTDYYDDGTSAHFCHRVIGHTAAPVFDGVGGAVVFTLLMVGLTAGLRNIRK